MRLIVEQFSGDSNMSFMRSALTQIIMNSKSKECGPLRLYDVNPAASCHQSSTKLFIISYFTLVRDIFCISQSIFKTIFLKVSEVKASFVLWDDSRENYVNDPLVDELTQPQDLMVLNQTVVVCVAPPQKWEVIEAIKRKKLQLRLCAYRPTDNRMSMNSLKYDYLPHVPSKSIEGIPGKNNV